MVVLGAGVLVRRTAVVAVGIALLGAGYAAHLVLDDPPLDSRAALVAAGLLLAAELGCWSIELGREVTREPGRNLRRLVAELGVCTGGLALSALVLAAAALLWLALDALRGTGAD